MPHPAVSCTRPLVFAHRGGSALAPENTLVAFDRGMALGADGLELDVHLSQDGIVVVHHDRTLERTTDGQGPLAAQTAAELDRIDAGFRFEKDGSYPYRQQGLAVPRFADVLDRYPRARLIVELKTDDARLARAVVAEVRRAGAADRVVVGGFGCSGVRAVRATDDEMATGACRDEVRWALYLSWIGLRSLWPAYQAFQVPERQDDTVVVSRRFIRAAHRMGAAVHVWTVDDPRDMERLLGWGVDGLITDRPDIAVPLVQQWASMNSRSSNR